MRPNGTSDTNVFTGKWLVVGHKRCSEKESHIGEEERYWEFFTNTAVRFASGTVAYGGKIKESHPGRKTVMEYAYYPSANRLCLSDPQLVAEGACRFRIEYRGGDELWLYELESVPVEEDNYRSCTKIRKIT